MGPECDDVIDLVVHDKAGERIVRQLASKLIPFFVTRQIFSGAGKIKPEKHGGYAISQRAQHIREEISIATTTARGIINTRDEPHADREKYRRLHVIVEKKRKKQEVMKRKKRKLKKKKKKKKEKKKKKKKKKS